MNAQQIINNCENIKFTQKKIRAELNIAWLISDAITEFKKQNAQY